MNTDGSYTCTCRDGFTGVGTFCIGMCDNINLIYSHIPKLSQSTQIMFLNGSLPNHHNQMPLLSPK